MVQTRVGGVDAGVGNTLSSPFRLCDIQFSIRTRTLCASNALLSNLQQAGFASLTFNDKKNSVWGESIVHSHSVHPHACSVLYLLSCLWYLLSCGAPATTPLYAIQMAIRGHSIRSSEITSMIHAACDTVSVSLGITARDISAHSLRVVRSVFLFLVNIDPDTIRFIFLCRSDEIIRYLCVTDKPIMHSYAATMVASGYYTLIPKITFCS